MLMDDQYPEGHGWSVDRAKNLMLPLSVREIHQYVQDDDGGFGAAASGTAEKQHWKKSQNHESIFSPAHP